MSRELRGFPISWATPAARRVKRRKALALDRLLRRAAILSDVAQDDRAPDEFLVRILAHQRHDIEIQEAILRIEDLEIAADDFARARSLPDVESADDLSERFAEAVFRIDSKESAGGAIQINDSTAGSVTITPSRIALKIVSRNPFSRAISTR